VVLQAYFAHEACECAQVLPAARLVDVAHGHEAGAFRVELDAALTLELEACSQNLVGDVDLADLECAHLLGRLVLNGEHVQDCFVALDFGDDVGVLLDLHPGGLDHAARLVPPDQLEFLFVLGRGEAVLQGVDEVVVVCDGVGPLEAEHVVARVDLWAEHEDAAVGVHVELDPLHDQAVFGFVLELLDFLEHGADEVEPGLALLELRRVVDGLRLVVVPRDLLLGAQSVLEPGELVHLLEAEHLLDLLVGGFADFLVLEELHHVAEQAQFAFLVDLNLLGADLLGHLRGVRELLAFHHVGPAAPEAFDLVGHGLVKVLLDRHAEVGFALGAQFVHDSAGGHDAGLGVLVAHLLLRIVLQSVAEAALRLGHVFEVGGVGEGLVQLLDLAVLDVGLLQKLLGARCGLVGAVDEGRFVELDFAVERDVLGGLVVHLDEGNGVVREHGALEVHVALADHLGLAGVEHSLDFAGVLLRLLALGAEEHLLEAEVDLELHEDTVFLLEFAFVGLDGVLHEHLLFDLLLLLAEFGVELLLGADFVLGAALEDHVVDLPAGAHVVFVVGFVEAFAALGAHADVVIDDAEEAGCAAGHAGAHFVVEPPALDLGELSDVIDFVALAGREDVADLGAFVLLEEVEGPVVLAHVHHSGNVHVPGGLVGLRRGRLVGHDGQRRVDALWLETRVVSLGGAVEVSVLQEPLESDLAALLGVHAHVHLVSEALLGEVDAALVVDCAHGFGQQFLLEALVHAAVVLDLGVLEQHGAIDLGDALLERLDALLRQDFLLVDFDREFLDVVRLLVEFHYDELFVGHDFLVVFD